MRAALRRTDADLESEPDLRFGDLQVDLARRLVRLGDDLVHLTPNEYGLLEAMVDESRASC